MSFTKRGWLLNQVLGSTATLIHFIYFWVMIFDPAILMSTFLEFCILKLGNGKHKHKYCAHHFKMAYLVWT